ncbi:hypothetical protein MASR1M45_00530 [Candidatus Kapaibacterium sp.]
MKKILYLVIIVLLCNHLVYSQFSADVDGKVNISPVNGNMQYVYPISNDTIDGYPLKVDMIYNSNVTFVAFDKHINWFDSTTNSKKDAWKKLSISMPVWILGVNGFAVQVLHDCKSSK